MLFHLAPERQLLQAGGARKIASRAFPEEVRVIVISFTRYARAFATGRRLLREVVEIGIAKRSVMEPVVTHPTVHHRALRSRHLQRRMRIYKRHYGGKALIRGTEHPHLAVGLGYIFYEPVDRIVRVGGVVDFAAIQWANWRRRHQIRAFRAIFAAHVLK